VRLLAVIYYIFSFPSHIFYFLSSFFKKTQQRKRVIMTEASKTEKKEAVEHINLKVVGSVSKGA
jgi:hypothetical protein